MQTKAFGWKAYHVLTPLEPFRGDFMTPYEALMSLGTPYVDPLLSREKDTEASKVRQSFLNVRDGIWVGNHYLKCPHYLKVHGLNHLHKSFIGLQLRIDYRQEAEKLPPCLGGN